MSRKYCYLYYFLLFFLLSLQVKAATINGYVQAKNNDLPLQDVQVRLLHASLQTTTDKNGFYSIAFTGGNDTIECSKPGFQTIQTIIRCSARETVTVSLALSLLSDSLPAVIVTTQQSVQQLQRNADAIVEIIDDNRIRQSSDITIADVAQHISGITVLNNKSGDDAQTIIRGMAPKYNATLLNGLKVPSPDHNSRNVPLNMFPSGVVQRIEVYKTLTADMDADAIGGAINLVMRTASEQPVFKVQFSIGYNQLLLSEPFIAFDKRAIQKQSPYEQYGADYYSTAKDFTKDNLSFKPVHPLPDVLANLVWSKRFLGQKLGVIIGSDYQDIKTINKSFYLSQNGDPQLNNAPGFTNFFSSTYSSRLIRKSLYAGINYQFNKHSYIQLRQFYNHQQDIESRISVDTSLVQGRSIPGTGRINIYQRSRAHFTSIYNTSLSGVHGDDSKLMVKWNTSYSVAKGLYPDWAELTANTARIENADGTVAQMPLLLSPLNRIWLRSRENQLEANITLRYPFTLLNTEASITAGELYRDKKRNNFYNSYTFNPALQNGNGQSFTDIYSAAWLNDNGPQNPLGAVANPNTYNGDEKIHAGFISTNAISKKSEWLIGLRYEATQQYITSSVNPVSNYGKYIRKQYVDWLPDVHYKYKLTGNANLRLSYYKSISRPALYDVTFYAVQYENYQEKGNPFLNRARAHNIDLQYEYYANNGAFFRANAFYKYILDPYENTLLNANDELYPVPDQGLPYTKAGQLTAQMRNFPPATNYGIEVSAAKRFGDFNIITNYTFTSSHITQLKKFKTRADIDNPASDIITVSKEEKRPMQGQAKNIANLSVIYNPSKELQVETDFVYTGKNIYLVSGWYGLNYYQKGRLILNASVNKSIGKRFRVFVKANNILNSGSVMMLNQPNPDYTKGLLPGQTTSKSIRVMQQVNKATYYLGVSFSVN